MGGKPVITLGYDDRVHAIYYTLKEKYEYFPLYSRTGLLKNEYKIYPWLKNQKF